MKTALTVTGALLVALAVARPFAQQPTTRLALEVQDYASLPIRKVVAARPTTAPAPAVTAATPSPVRTSAASQPRISRIP